MKHFIKSHKTPRSFLRFIISLFLIWMILLIQVETVHGISTIILRFNEHLCEANWTSSAPGQPLSILKCPGSSSDSIGFVLPLTNSSYLENGLRAETTFETHPSWYTDGWINGTFSLSELGYVILSGDHLLGQVGLMQGASSGNVKFTIQYDQSPIEPGGEVKLFEEVDGYDGILLSFDIDLSRFAGGSGDLMINVNAAGSSGQDWAIWKDLRIERQTPTATFTPSRTGTATPTASITPTPTSTSTPTPTTTLIISPTSTTTLLPNPTPLPPIPTIELPPQKPCACFESSILDTYFSGNDGIAVGKFLDGYDLLILTVVDEKAAGENGLFTIMTADGTVVSSFEARFTPNDVIVVGDVWGDAATDEILVGIDEDQKVYVYDGNGTLLETKTIPYTRYDILAVGNVLNGPNDQGDEIIFAGDETDKFTIFSRSGSYLTVTLDWNFDGNSVPGIKNDSHSDALTVGNVFGDDLEEIIFVDQNGDNSIVYFYNQLGKLVLKTKIRFTKFDAFAAGDILGNEFDEILVGIDEDRAIYILDPMGGILKLFHGRVTPVDVIVAADISASGKDDILLAVDDDNKVYIYLQE